mgnify:CR=1 FL=1
MPATSVEPQTSTERTLLPSDADRDQARAVLQQAYADGRIRDDELEARLERLEHAASQSAVDATLEGLPTPSTALVPRPVDNAAMVLATEANSRLLGLMSGVTRKGHWHVPDVMSVNAFWGGVLLDFTDAIFTSSSVRIDARAVMGGVGLKVPDDVAVVSHGMGIMGGFANTVHEPERPRAVLHLHGFAFWGGVGVQVVSAPTSRDEEP